MKKILLLIFILASLRGFAQTDIPDNMLPQKPFIEVTGTASKEVIPDKIFISVSLIDKAVNNQTYTIQQQEDKLKKALAKINIDAASLSLSDATSGITTYKGKETGFKVTKEYILIVKSASQVSDVFKELYAINIKEASILKAENSMIDSLRKEVRIAAIKAAKDKADYLLHAIGEEVGKPLDIHEQEDIPFFRENTSNTLLTSFNNQPGSKPEETNFQKFTIQFTYYIKYAIR